LSVINGTTNTKIGNDIPVGKEPAAIDFNFFTNRIYVVNRGDNTVSVINGMDNTKIGKELLLEDILPL